MSWKTSPELMKTRAIDNLKASGGQLRTHRILWEAALANAESAARDAHSVGFSETRIATELGVPRTTVHRWLVGERG